MSDNHDPQFQGEKAPYVMVFDTGWDVMLELTQKSLSAARLFMFLSKCITDDCGAVATDQKILSEHLGCSRKTIQRAVKTLEEENLLIRLPMVGRLEVYCLDPSVVWKGYQAAKDVSFFKTGVITRRDIKIEDQLKRQAEKRAKVNSKEYNNSVDMGIFDED